MHYSVPLLSQTDGFEYLWSVMSVINTPPPPIFLYFELFYCNARQKISKRILSNPYVF